MRLALAMTLVVVAAGTALAWDEPDAVRGLTWGASQEDLRRVAKDRGEPAPLCASAATSNFGCTAERSTRASLRSCCGARWTDSMPNGRRASRKGRTIYD
jgi:hypothetical protein